MRSLTLKGVILGLVLMSSHTIIMGQDAKSLEKVLQKAVKEVIKEPIRVPGVDLDMAGARGLALAQTVNNSVNEALKESLKQSYWNTEGLAETDLLQVHNSTTPAATFRDYHEAASGQSLKKLVFDQLNAADISGLLSSMGADPGFYFSSSQVSDYMEDVYANMLANLDNAAKERMK